MAVIAEENWCCDRCGAERLVRLESDDSPKYLHRPDDWTDLEVHGQARKDVDLCKACTASFAEWMAGGKS